MPDSLFPTQEEKDTFCCYFFKKIVAGLKKREYIMHKAGNVDKRLKVNLMIDVIYQLPNLQIAVSKVFNQVAKFKFKPIICAHNLQQLQKPLRDEIVNSAVDTLFLQNCSEDVFKPFEKRITTYKPEDLTTIPKFHALALLRTNTGSTINHIVRLPGNINKNFRKEGI
jgi:hypothetical protein